MQKSAEFKIFTDQANEKTT